MSGDSRVRFVGSAPMVVDGKPKFGFLILTDEALIFVPSVIGRVGVAFGMIGAAIANLAVKGKAAAAAASPPAGSTVIGLDQIAATGHAKFRLARKILVVTRTDGIVVQFAVPYARWQPHLAAALAGRGATVAPIA